MGFDRRCCVCGRLVSPSACLSDCDFELDAAGNVVHAIVKYVCLDCLPVYLESLETDLNLSKA